VERTITDTLSELGRRLEARGGVAAANLARGMLAPEITAEWLGRYPGLPVATPRNVLVITAGNIPFVGMQDLICVLAAGHRALVKASLRDRDNMAWTVETLLDIDPSLPVAMYDDTTPPDAVVAMGGDAAVAAIGARYAGVPTLLRGHRASAAMLTGGETEAELRALADDITLHSGLGCRNVSLLLVPRGYDFAPLARTLAPRDGDAPSGGYRQARAMLRMAGVEHTDCGGCLLVEEDGFPAAAGVVNYMYYDDSAEAAEWIGRHDGEIQCVAIPPRLAAIHPRAVAFGDTQRPRPWDYPDGRDTMQFLMEL